MNTSSRTSSRSTASGESATKHPPERGLGILLVDSTLAPYLFVRNLAQGVQGAIQVCWDIKNQEYVVRKRSLNWIGTQRAERPDREARIAREIQRRQARLPAGARAASYEFARLISTGTLTLEEQNSQVRLYRDSYWAFYNGGGSLENLLDFLANGSHKPHALILNILHSVLLSLQWMNSFELHHLDMHCGNVFLRWDDEGQLHPVIGDFGLSRFNAPLEPPPNHISMMGKRPPRGSSQAPSSEDSQDTSDPQSSSGSSDQRDRSHNLSSAPFPEHRDASQRLPLDFIRFILLFIPILEDVFPKRTPEDTRMFEVIERLRQAGIREAREDANAVFEFNTREADPNADPPVADGETPNYPARVDITTLIADVKAAEEEYVLTGGLASKEAALDAWRRHTEGTMKIPVWYTEAQAVRNATFLVRGRGPYELVDVADPASIQAGVDRLAVRTGYTGSRQSSLSSLAASSHDGGASDGAKKALPDKMNAGRSRKGSSEPAISEENQHHTEDQPEVNAVADWFTTVFVPAAERQYIAKWQARSLNQSWDACVMLNIDADTPGPGGVDREAIRQWLLVTLRPVFEAVARRIRSS